MDAAPRILKITGRRPTIARRADGTDSRPARKAAPAVFTLTLPRQHGAWASLLAAFILGTVAGGRFGPEVLLLLFAVLAAFVGRQAFLVALKLPVDDTRRGDVRIWTAVYVAIFATAALSLVIAWDLRYLLALGAAAFLLLAFTTLLERRGRSFSVVAEAAGFAGLSLAAPAAEYAATGTLSGRTAAVGLLCAAYFLGSLLHVRFVLRTPLATRYTLRGRLQAGAGSATLHLHALGFSAAAVTLGWLPPLVPLAFAPAAYRALRAVFLHRGARAAVRTLGWQEAAHMLVFVVVASTAYLLA
jgi:hypothetical protein